MDRHDAPDSAEQTTGPLGETTSYIDGYQPDLLHPMTRAATREAADVTQMLACHGSDRWTGYEFSWLDPVGKPQVAGLSFSVDCHSKCVVESKSLKLYLNGFAQTQFADRDAVAGILRRDLGAAFAGQLTLDLLPLDGLAKSLATAPGECLDDLDAVCTDYQRAPQRLIRATAEASAGGANGAGEQCWYTHLFRSLCPVTGQPDWATVVIWYRGAPVDTKGLLQYLVSYRNHQAFHETTIEQIYLDLMAHWEPTELAILGCFQRRGGLDINPFRSSAPRSIAPLRLARQ